MLNCNDMQRGHFQFGNTGDILALVQHCIIAQVNKTLSLAAYTADKLGLG